MLNTTLPTQGNYSFSTDIGTLSSIILVSQNIISATKLLSAYVPSNIASLSHTCTLGTLNSVAPFAPLFSLSAAIFNTRPEYIDEIKNRAHFYFGL